MKETTNIEWILCPECGKKLLRADTSKTVTLYPWCKSCKKEVEVKIELPTTSEELEECRIKNVKVETDFHPGVYLSPVTYYGCRKGNRLSKAIFNQDMTTEQCQVLAKRAVHELCDQCQFNK